MARTDSACRFCSQQCSGRWHSGQANGNYKDGLSKTKWWYHANKERHKATQAKYHASPKGQAAKARALETAKANRKSKRDRRLAEEKANPELLTKPKCCSDCREQKPLSEFHRHHDTQDGRATICKSCAAERVRVSRKRNPAMYERQKRDSAASAQLAFLANPEPKRRRERARYWAKREEYQARGREDYLRNPESAKAAAKRRKLRLRGAWTPEGESYAAFVAQDPCVYCGAPGTTVDHIIPLIAEGRTLRKISRPRVSLATHRRGTSRCSTFYWVDYNRQPD